MIKIELEDGMIVNLPLWARLMKVVGETKKEWDKVSGKKIWILKTGESHDEETGRIYQDLEIHLCED